jgi:hypothetical protein
MEVLGGVAATQRDALLHDSAPVMKLKRGNSLVFTRETTGLEGTEGSLAGIMGSGN